MLFKAKKRVHNYLVHLINPIKFNNNLKYFSSSPPVWESYFEEKIAILASIPEISF